MHLWVIIQIRKGLSIRAASCTNEQITKMVTRTAFFISRHDTEDSTSAVPAVLSSYTQWRTWWESCHTYIKQLRGANNIPLCYIHRIHVEVTDTITAYPYKDTNMEYIHTFKLEGVEYAANGKIYSETLNPLLLTGPA